LRNTAAMQHLHVWLTATGLDYGHAARQAFVLAHPRLFGSAYELTLRGYDRWRRRHHVPDTVAAFADYISPRHQRWLRANIEPGLAQCLIGSSVGPPCWQITRSNDAAAVARLHLAA